jgi:glycosyltransferase involved in cell wall biosynthesis
MSAEGEVSIVVPTYRRPDALRETLHGLLALDFPAGRYEVIVVDDGSGDETADVVAECRRSNIPELTYLPQPSRGAAAARNVGAAAAGGKLLLFCDDDMLLAPSHLALVMQTRELHGDCAVNGVRWFTPEIETALAQTPFGRFRLDLEREFWRTEGVALDATCTQVPSLSACDLAVAADVFTALGGFDEDVPYAGAEDQDFSYRAARAGCRLIRNAAIRSLHNDQLVSLERFCAREERSAATIGVLAVKHPADFGCTDLVVKNGPIRASDGARLISKKLVKGALSRRFLLAPLHVTARALERLRAPDAALRRLYNALLALHIFRGVRAGLQRGRPRPVAPCDCD